MIERWVAWENLRIKDATEFMIKNKKPVSMCHTFPHHSRNLSNLLFFFLLFFDMLEFCQRPEQSTKLEKFAEDYYGRGIMWRWLWRCRWLWRWLGSSSETFLEYNNYSNCVTHNRMHQTLLCVISSEIEILVVNFLANTICSAKAGTYDS